MKVLMLTPILPYPLYSGGQVRIYNLIKNLAKKHEITLFSFIRRDEERQFLPELLKYCPKVEVFKKQKPWAPETLFKSAFSTYPLVMKMYDFPEVKQKISQELTVSKYDLIHGECFYVMQNLPRTSVPVVLTEQNIEYLVYQRFAKNFSFWPLKPILYYDVSKIRFWERYFWQKADKIITMSKEESEIIGLEKTCVVENGVDSKYFGQKIFQKKWKEPTVVFVGNFRWLQNRETLTVLVREIWPQVKKAIPEAKLWVVGKDLPSARRKGIPSEVVVEEGIEDIRKAYQGADLLLAPIRIGGGTSYKILEAMASGLTVVTTPLGIEGIEAKDGQEVIVRDNSQELAEAVVGLLKDEKKRKEIGERAEKLMREKYDWGKISQKLEKIWLSCR